MYDIEEFDLRLRSALMEPSVARARSILRGTAEHTESASKTDASSPELSRVCALAYGYLASLTDSLAERIRYRARALRVCTRGLDRNDDYTPLIATQANLVVDWFYDSLAPADPLRIRSSLARARRRCEERLASEACKEARVRLFVQIASILRCQAQLHRDSGHALTQRAKRTSQAACNENPSSALALLDLGLSCQACARWCHSEPEFYRSVESAERALHKSHSAGLALATLCLARLCRQTYRPGEAIRWFGDFAEREPRRRVVLAEAHIVGESAVLLLYRQMKAPILRRQLECAQDLLSEALRAGYKEARLLVALARIRHALDDTVGSVDFLRQLVRDERTEWTLAVEDARKVIQQGELNVLHTAFALGMANGLVWNSIATYVKDVMRDDGFALRLYEVALKLSPSSPVIHTNIARLCLASSDRGMWVRGKHHLETARAYADSAFRFWKPLYDEVTARLANRPSHAESYRTAREGDSLDQIYVKLTELEQLTSDPLNRGRQLHRLFPIMLTLSFGTNKVAGSLNLEGVQSDASFMHGGHCYRAEISWDKKPNDRTEIGKLVERLQRTQGARGLLVSMSGFTKGVYEEMHRRKSEHVIFLMNKCEFRQILRGEKRFESWIEEKELEFYLGS